MLLRLGCYFLQCCLQKKIAKIFVVCVCFTWRYYPLPPPIRNNTSNLSITWGKFGDLLALPQHTHTSVSTDPHIHTTRTHTHTATPLSCQSLDGHGTMSNWTTCKGLWHFFSLLFFFWFLVLLSRIQNASLSARSSPFISISALTSA